MNFNPTSASCVTVISESAPKDSTAASEINLRSSPIDASAATPSPPPTVNAPSVALVFAVVAVIETTPPEDIPIAFVSEADPIVPASGITIAPEPPLSVSTPVDDNFIFSAAASEAAVLKDNFVALLDPLKSPSETASIPAATKIASVPVPSSGAWKSIFPKTSSTAISVSPV